jgi:hypothetical protein
MEMGGDNKLQDEKQVQDAKVQDEKQEWEQEKMGLRWIASLNASARARVRLENRSNNEGEMNTSQKWGVELSLFVFVTTRNRKEDQNSQNHIFQGQSHCPEITSLLRSNPK